MKERKYDSAMALAREIGQSELTEAQRTELDAFVEAALTAITAEVDDLERDAIALQLGEAADMLNLTYIAKKYFKKSHSWLSQRLHGHLVNGKPCRFTDAELHTFNAALRDMSLRLNAITLRY